MLKKKRNSLTSDKGRPPPPVTSSLCLLLTFQTNQCSARLRHTHKCVCGVWAVTDPLPVIWRAKRNSCYPLDGGDLLLTHCQARMHTNTHACMRRYSIATPQARCSLLQDLVCQCFLWGITSPKYNFFFFFYLFLQKLHRHATGHTGWGLNFKSPSSPEDLIVLIV